MAYSASSASNSDHSATHTSLHQVVTTDSVVPVVLEEKPQPIDPVAYMNSNYYIEKFKKYEADYTHWLKAKYFSDKNIYGGNIFDVKLTIDGETIKASRWPGTRSYSDPVSFLADQNSSGSPSESETPTNSPDGKHLENMSS